MKRQTAIMLIKLSVGLSLFTGIIAVVFIFFAPRFMTKSTSTSVPTASPTFSETKTPTEVPTPTTQGMFCGGIAGKQCPAGYTCKLSGNYPDAGGTCIGEMNKPTDAMVACTMEAKLCPDGSSVGRSGPKCEFAPCPK